MNRFEDDKFSMTNVSLLDENISTPRNITSSPVSISANQRQFSNNRRFSTLNADELGNEKYNERDSRPISTSLKAQESTLDVLKKENFNLKLRLYFLEERVRDSSPESVEKAIKENINNKMALQSLTSELKRYKAMILELNQGIDILQEKTCPKIHGMTPEEREEFEKIKAEAEAYHEETDKLSLSLANLTAENVRLRTTIRSSRVATNNAPPSPPANAPESEDVIELRRKYRQAKIKIEEQQRAMQMMNNNAQNNRAYGNNQGGDDYHSNQIKKQLEGELRMERLEIDRVYNELQDKNKDIHSLQLELDQYTKSLHDTKQQLRGKTIECEQLREENEKMLVDRNDMEQVIKAVSELQEDNDQLVVAIQNRDQDIAELEAEVEKLLSHLEEKGEDDDNGNNNNNEATNNKIMMLEEAINEREEKIDMLSKELKETNESHDDDIEVFEEHIAKAQEEIKKKQDQNNELMLELENVKKICEEELDKQYNELAVSIREREVRIASLEGNFEQKTDTMQRERDLLGEEIEELKDKLHVAFDELRQKENAIQELSDALNNRDEVDVSYLLQSDKMQEYIQRWENRSNELETKYKKTREKLMEDRTQAKAKATQQHNAYVDLKNKYLIVTEKYDLLNKIVDGDTKSTEIKSGAAIKEKTRLLNKLNRELRKELDERGSECEHERHRGDELEKLYQMELEANITLKKQLERKTTMLTNSLLAHDNLKEQGEFMGNILYEQATGGHQIFRERTPSAMSSF
ncbi:hypothetical protein BDF21DRAFT_416903 [Thamnidium elegans]|uniref:Centrosomin N-terminal motif 1 domain-containing protein n=1 Tax=Thamnidium elegans TaxID=101142 RepID=A0A8H7T0Q2_9FUNG|nr:hypothetical protein INT48_009670 [Thamnidium elegans]KAI8083932.1 hypothetical protein BDF21DRAFT_416903 [Thamnidium elegans]